MTQRPDPLGWIHHDLAGKYRIQQVVGEGGFGLVYRALHLGLQSRVAVKCLKVPSNLSSQDRAQFEEAFFNEGKLLHQLSRATASIAQSLDLGTATSPLGSWTPYIVLEWLDGRSLREELDARHQTGNAVWSVSDAYELLSPAIEALAEAHAQGIAHRDVKPANLFLAKVGGRIKVKVMDFGIAKMMGESTTLTRAMEQTGDSIKAFTPRYGAPEQFRSTREATGPWTDVFALALIFVELITGRPALDGNDAIQLFVASGDPKSRPTPRSRGIQVTDELEAVLLRALAVSPRERYLSAHDFGVALRAAVMPYLSSRQSVVSPVTNTLAVAAHAEHLPSSPLPLTMQSSDDSSVQHRLQTTNSPHVQASLAATSSTRKSILPWLALAFAATTLLVVGAVLSLGGWLLWFSEPPEDTPETSARAVAPPASTPDSSSEDLEVLVTAGMYRMGSDSGGYAERPAHSVTISRNFYIDSVEVTVAQYEQCIQAGACEKLPESGIVGRSPRPNGSSPTVQCNTTFQDRMAHPVNCVTYKQAEAFCRWKHKRLPTEAEWEYAAKGNGTGAYPWGNGLPECKILVVDRAAGGACEHFGRGTAPIGIHLATKTPFGAFDMAGNVAEWVADSYISHAYQKGDQRDPYYPMTPKTKRGIVRGGSWSSTRRDASAWRRLPVAPNTVSASIGFRCARDAR